MLHVARGHCIALFLRCIVRSALGHTGKLLWPWRHYFRPLFCCFLRPASILSSMLVFNRLWAKMPKSLDLLSVFMCVSLVAMVVGRTYSLSRMPFEDFLLQRRLPTGEEYPTVVVFTNFIQAGAIVVAICAVVQSSLLAKTTEVTDPSAPQRKGPRRRGLETIAQWNAILALTLALDLVGFLYIWTPPDGGGAYNAAMSTHPLVHSPHSPHSPH